MTAAPIGATSAGAAAPAIRIDGVTFAYPGSPPALRDVDLEIAAGEFVAVLGANGAGKTTLCLMLNGVIPNVIGGTLSGQVEIEGLVTSEHHVYELAEHVGVVLQDPDAQILATTVRSEVAFAAENLGIPRADLVERVDGALATVRLAGFDEAAPEELSGGQKQRLAIAAGLVVRPAIFVLDEPTAQLDPVGTDETFEVLARLNADDGATIVVATHASEAVADHARRVIVLDAGRVVADGPPEEVFSRIDLLDRVGVAVPEVVRIQAALSPPLAPPPALTVTATADAIRPILGAVPRADALDPGSSAPPTAPGPPLIDVRDLRFSYPSTQSSALDGIDVSIGRGEFVALIGQNGSGKSTLVKCLAGLLRPASGEIRIDDELVTPKTARALPRRIGVVLQNPDTQLFRMSVREEVAFGLQNIGVPESEQQERIQAALDLTGLTAAADVYPFKLSFGDRRKVAVASIVAMRPLVLVFDEPTTGQDYAGRYRLCEIARDLNGLGTTVIMITHDMDLVARYAPRTVVLGLGRVILDGPTRDAFARPDVLRETYLEPPQAARLAQELAPSIGPTSALSVDELLAALRPGTAVEPRPPVAGTPA
ncbi:MAG TPA: energy-coupling factor transporter ATPase [Candidatus Limnocylindrales bacterium]|nr:energy-coupling factor transporter ATPase [Candidatus Limnocylindrales bacterium]